MSIVKIQVKNIFSFSIKLSFVLTHQYKKMSPQDVMQILCKSTSHRYNSIKDLPKFEKAEMQREIDDERVDEIRLYLRKNRSTSETKTKKNDVQIGPPLGNISLGKYNGSYYVIDGQHRLAALQSENLESKFDMFVDTITYECNDYLDLVKVFQVINKNKQVPKYILKAENKPLIELLKQIEKHLKKNSPLIGNDLKKKVPLIGDDSKHKKRPYLYLPDFIETLSANNGKFLENNKITNLEQFKLILDTINVKYKVKLTDPEFKKYHKISEPMQKHCTAANFFVSLVPHHDWRHELFV